jgi:hypothetical protein
LIDQSRSNLRQSLPVLYGDTIEKSMKIARSQANLSYSC